MAITAEALARALRVDYTDADISAEIDRLAGSTLAMVSRHAPETPDAIVIEAQIRLAGYLFDAPPGESGAVRSPLIHSGAAALLAPYRVHRAGIVGGETTGAGPAGDATDPVAREAAEAAQMVAAAAQLAADAAQGTANDANAAAAAAAGIAQGAAREAAVNTGFLGTFAARVQAVVERIVPAWARAAQPPEPGDALPAYEQAETQGLFSRAGALFWRLVNEVPDTPGESSGVGHVLTVTGENDQDYQWRAPTGGAATPGERLEVVPVARVATLPANYGDYDFGYASVIAQNQHRGHTFFIAELEGAAALQIRLGSSTVLEWDRSARTLTANQGVFDPVQLFNIGAAGSAVDAQARQSAATNAGNITAVEGVSAANRRSVAALEGALPDPPVPAAVEAETDYKLRLPASTAQSTRAVWVPDVARPGLTPEQTAALAGITVDDETAARTAADAALGRRIDAIEPPDPIINPDYWLSTHDERTFIVHLDKALVNVVGVTRIGLTVEGIAKTAFRVADQTGYSFTFTAADAANIAQNLRGATVVRALIATGNDGFSQGFFRSETVLRVLAAAPAFADAAAVAALAARVATLEARPSPQGIPAWERRAWARGDYSFVATDIGKMLAFRSQSGRSVALTLPNDIGEAGDKIYVSAFMEANAAGTAAGKITLTTAPRDPAMQIYGVTTQVGSQVTSESTFSLLESFGNFDFPQSVLVTLHKSADDGPWQVIRGIW